MRTFKPSPGICFDHPRSFGKCCLGRRLPSVQASSEMSDGML
ncbi:MAG TPA: hypothetical protein VGB73_02105 [Pyrinomonadaceae bacterium]